MDTETVTFLRQLAAARARKAPARLRPAACWASIHRWTGMLAVAAQRAYVQLIIPSGGGGGALLKLYWDEGFQVAARGGQAFFAVRFITHLCWLAHKT